ncbi:MAG: proteasome-type protease [Cyanobacteria bacterium P01_A01_bin.3]
MTYCLGIINSNGIVMAADSRTNAGLDYISTYNKLFDFSVPNERVIIMCASGNLSITQGVVNRIEREIETEAVPNLHTLESMFDIAAYIGRKSREVQKVDRPWMEKDRIDFNCNFLLGGQLRGEEPQLFLVYTQGNFIQATPETPFLQIGEMKYGKPILDRTIAFDTPLEDIAKCALLSIDSTMKSNITVGPPINLVMYEANRFAIEHTLQLRLGNPYLAKIRRLWEKSVRSAFESMPNIEWEEAEALASTDEEIIID